MSDPVPHVIYLIARYRCDQYERLLIECEDGACLPATYDLWLEAFNREADELSRSGAGVYTIEVDLGELLIWCGVNGLTTRTGRVLSFMKYKLALHLSGLTGSDLIH
ncbi:MAG TPA: hypothetical protein VFD58_04300 [Blastocatellia bacterium]|nr:hypothetical protein [Blastocatellia bacterium]